MRDIRRNSLLTKATRALAAASALAIVTTYMPLVGARAAAPKPLFDEIGTLERLPADARAVLGSKVVPPYGATDFEQRGRAGTAIIIASSRQLWQIYTSTAITSPQVWAATVRDLDSLRIIRTVTLPSSIQRDTLSTGGSWSHAVDDRGKRLFLLANARKEILEIDLRTFAVKSRPLPHSLPPAQAAGLVSIVPGGLTYDPYGDDLLILYGGPAANSAADTNTLLYTLDVSGPTVAASLTPFYYFRSCTGPLSSVDAGGETYGWEILVSEAFLYVPCHRAGNTGAVVRMTRPKPLNHTPTAEQPVQPEEVVVGPVYAETVLADQVGGRLFMTTTRREVWVFEASTMSFIGIVATGPENTDLPTGYGLDQQTGRLFFQSATFGLGVAEGRFFPIPQARTMPHKATGQERILSDAPTGRVFVLEDSGTSKPPAYRLYKTDPAPVPSAPPDPDRNTVDMPEREGVTEARYNASGSGYGVRVLLAKGLSTVAPAPNLGVVTPTAERIDKNVNSKCGYTDRELVAGRVVKAEYDTGSAAASAIAFDVDSATGQDLDKPSRCDVTVRDTSGTQQFGGIFATQPVASHEPDTQADDPDTPEQESRWTLEPATCSSSEGDPDDGEGTGTFLDTGRDFGSSNVSCPTPSGKLTATAATELTGGISVAKAWTDTTIERGSFGVRSIVEAVAQVVDIAAGTITFAEIRSRAESTSNGRPQKDNMSAHMVTARGVRLNGATLCDEECDLTTLVDELNIAAVGKAIFRAGTGANSGRDEALLQGSPRGALTAVQKSAARQASDRALVGDFTTEIPGLEMTVFNDNTQWGRARQVYQFAGVASSATYNIVLRPTGLGFTDDGPGAFSADSGDTPFEGLVEQLEHGSPNVGLGSTQPVVGDNSLGGILRPLRALVRGIRLFFTNPRHSLLLLTAWALFSLPGVLSRRRRLLVGVRSN